MGRMGRFTDHERNHSRTGEPAERDKESYSYDAIGPSLTLSEEKALDYHNYAAGTRGEGGARRKNWSLDRSPTWHDTKDSDMVNWGYGPEYTEEKTDA